MAITACLRQPFPIRGFAVFSPSVPGNLERTDASAVLKGAILAGDQDYLFGRQQEMIAKLDAVVELKTTLLPAHGHEYPEDFDKRMNEMIGFLSGGE